MGNYVREGYPQIIPYFVVENADLFIDFVEKTFNAREIEKHYDDHGRIEHAAYQVGGSIVELSDGNKKFPACQNTIHIYVPDTDTVYEKALAAGAVSFFAPESMPYGERSAGVEDPFGNRWFFATWGK